MIFSRVFAISLLIRSILLFAIGHFSFLFGAALPVHQPVAFDTLIVKVIAFYLAGVAGIALNGIDAAAVPAKHKPHMVGNAV
ncbi:exported hypothetical protein [Clostridioides difficile T61]|nr:exported hypothetical protein [Clostridioides difficile E16]CCL94509.1 exported hypothetical protein [Clostridioides difficile T61]